MGGLSAVGTGLYSIGISKDSILRYMRLFARPFTSHATSGAGPWRCIESRNQSLWSDRLSIRSKRGLRYE